jgi:hypothetical protein
MAKKYIFVGLFAAIFAAAIFYTSGQMELAFANSAILTGYSLFGLILFVAAFNVRKKLSVLPLFRASTWLVFHVIGGLLCFVLFWLHTDSIWPLGVYESLLALIFYLVCLSGIAGFIIQRLNARSLTETGIEVIYERIPAELANLREEVEQIVLDCTEKTGSDTVANHYVDTLMWYFRQPRFYWPIIFRHGNASTWLRNNKASVSRYLNAEEMGYFNQVVRNIELKKLIDVHYALQDINKKWLLLHLPLSAGLLLMSFWHLLLVEVFAL